jgi:cobalt-zinc-cadmium efflux system membrane fusion protein
MEERHLYADGAYRGTRHNGCNSGWNPVDGTTAPYVIDAADRYEVVAQLPERLVGTVRSGMTVQIAPNIVGRIIAVGSTIDPATRSASLKAQIPPGAGIVSGRATSLTIFGPAPSGAVKVPETAVTVIDGKQVVFVTTRDGFAIREVTHGDPAGNQIVVLSGLKPAEQVVVTGTSALKALAHSR